MDKRQKGFSFMIGPIRRTLTLIVLSVRDMLASAGPVVLLAVGVLVAARGRRSGLDQRRRAGVGAQQMGTVGARLFARHGMGRHPNGHTLDR